MPRSGRNKTLCLDQSNPATVPNDNLSGSDRSTFVTVDQFFNCGGAKAYEVCLSLIIWSNIFSIRNLQGAICGLRCSIPGRRSGLRQSSPNLPDLRTARGEHAVLKAV